MNPGILSRVTVKRPNRQRNFSSQPGSPMGEYNKVILLGNLTRDPDLRYTRRACQCVSSRLPCITVIV
jgi:hypothetical protein